MPEKRTKEGKAAKMKYDIEYVKQNVRQYMLKINRLTDPDMVEHLEKQDNKQGYLKSLVRYDMEHNVIEKEGE